MTARASPIRQSFWFRAAPALFYVVLVFIGGSMPMPEMPEGRPMPSDKLMHLVAFAVMQFVMFRAVRWRWPHAVVAAQNALAGVLSVAAGALLEFWQAALPHRSAELADWLFDTLGVLLGAGLLALVTRSAPAVEAVASEPGERGR